MATDAEKRAWLRDNTTEDVPTRGRLRPELLTIWERAHPDADAPDDPDWDIDGGDGETIALDEREPDVPMTPERKPRTQKAARAETRAKTSFADRLLNAGKPKTTPAGKRPVKKAPPRMSVEKFTSRMYSNLGRMVAPLSRPMSNCLQAQAAFAGVVLEDMVRGTVVDRVMQPMARAEDKLDKGFALFVPPLAVLAIEHSMTLPADQMMIRQAFIMPVLRESLRVGLEVSEAMADQLQARVRENARMDAEVDKLIRLIFDQEPVGAAEDAREPEMAGASA